VAIRVALEEQDVVHLSLFRQQLVQAGEVFTHAAHFGEFGVGVELGLGVGVGRGVGAEVDPGCVAGAVVGGAPSTAPGAVIVWPAEGGGEESVRPGELSGCSGNPETPGEGMGGPNPPTVSTAALTALSAPVPAQVPTPPKADHRRPMSGIWPIHAPMPTVRQRRPIEILRNARTMPGSSWVPATPVSS